MQKIKNSTTFIRNVWKSISRSISRTFHSGFELVGSWERSKKLIQQDFPEVKSYATIDELLEDTVDLVIVNTPVETHYEYAKQVLACRKTCHCRESIYHNRCRSTGISGYGQRKRAKNLPFFKTEDGIAISKLYKKLFRKILGEIVEAEFHFDRYNPILSPKATQRKRQFWCWNSERFRTHFNRSSAAFVWFATSSFC